MYEKTEYCDVFKTRCTTGTVYQRQELEKYLKENDLDYNITAFTYNQWNKGMDSINPLFEKTGRGLYKYLGDTEESKFSGKVIHKPQSKKAVYHIATWDDGKVDFEGDFSSFEEWKESQYDGENFVQEGAIIKVTYLDKERTWGIGVDDMNAQKIDPESALGKTLLGLKEGDTFNVNGNEGKILEINI